MAALLALFAYQSLRAADGKSPAAETFSNYGYGRILLTGDTQNWTEFAREGSVPAAALFTIFADWRTHLSKWLGDPKPYEFLPYTLPDVHWVALPSLLLTLVALGLLWWFMRRAVSPGAAAATLLVATFEPNLLGLSHFATLDAARMAGFLAGCVAMHFYWRKPTVGHLISSAVVIAAAQLTGLSNLLLYLIVAVVILLRELRDERTASSPGSIHRWRDISIHGFGAAFVLATAFVLVLNLAYWKIPDAKVLDAIRNTPSAELITRHAPILSRLQPVIPLGYTWSVAKAVQQNAAGHWAYLHGHFSMHGWWYYFPVALGLKLPLLVLALALAGLVWMAVSARARALSLLVIPAAIYLAFYCLYVHINTGVRQVLPVVPALLGLAGFALWRIAELAREWKGSVYALCTSALVWQSVMAFPHYEQFFNMFARGPEEGWKWLADSNIDFGQEEYVLRKWVKKNRGRVTINPTAPTPGILLIRAVDCVGMTPQATRANKWLREGFEPVKRPSPALMVYDVPSSAVVALRARMIYDRSRRPLSARAGIRAQQLQKMRARAAERQTSGTGSALE